LIIAWNLFLYETMVARSPLSNHTSPTRPIGSYMVDRLIMVSNSYSTTKFSQYDALGEVLGSQQATPPLMQSPYGFTYAYNLLGGLNSVTYPTGRTLSMVLNGGNLLLRETPENVINCFDWLRRHATKRILGRSKFQCRRSKMRPVTQPLAYRGINPLGGP